MIVRTFFAGAAALLSACDTTKTVTNTREVTFESSEDAPKPVAEIDEPAADGSATADTSAAGVTGPGSQSNWLTSSKIDPMTDRQVRTATVRLTGNVFDVVIEYQCRDDGYGKYVLTAFDKALRPAALQTRYSGNAYKVVFEMRVDHDRVWPGVAQEQRFNNQAVFTAGYEANKLTLSMHFTSGDEIYVLDQTDPAFRSVARGCDQRPVIAPKPSPVPSGDQQPDDGQTGNSD